VSALLALTQSAVQAVKEIVSSAEEAPETGGLRVVADRAGARANLELSVVALPGEDDEVVEEQGARVFLDPGAASLLEDKVLDASIEQEQVARLRSRTSSRIDLAADRPVYPGLSAAFTDQRADDGAAVGALDNRGASPPRAGAAGDAVAVTAGASATHVAPREEEK